MTVIITDIEAMPRFAPTPDLLQGEAAIAATNAGEAIWRPDDAPSGPISLIVSAADKRLVVLRNGTMIGSTPVTVSGAVTATTAYSLSQVDAQGFHWMQLPLPGDTWGGSREMPPSDRAMVQMPGLSEALWMVFLCPILPS